jgi:hypothetical protein
MTLSYETPETLVEGPLLDEDYILGFSTDFLEEEGDLPLTPTLAALFVLVVVDPVC